MNVTKLRMTDWLTFSFKVGDLSGDQSSAAGGDGNLAENLAKIIVKRGVCFGRNLERDCQKSVACKYCDAVAEDFMTGGPAAAEIIVIHAREIIMDERIGMDALDGAGEGKCRSP